VTYLKAIGSPKTFNPFNFSTYALFVASSPSSEYSQSSASCRALRRASFSAEVM
jgi:hypothetical protein